MIDLRACLATLVDPGGLAFGPSVKIYPLAYGPVALLGPANLDHAFGVAMRTASGELIQGPGP
jgi:hypothetical protein